MMDNNDVQRPNAQRCPNCGKSTDPEFRPFCSGRCKDVDLARWLTGAYTISGSNIDEDGKREVTLVKPEKQ